MQQKLACPVLAQCVVILSGFGASNSFAINLQPGHLIVADSHNLTLPVGATIVDIDPKTGVQTLIATGGDLQQPTGLCLDSAGNIIVADYGYNPGQTGSIIRINPVTGQQTVVSTGGLLADPTSVAVDSQGFLIVAQEGLNQVTGAVLRINPATGAQTVISSGYPMKVPTGLAIDGSGHYLVSNFQGPGGSSILNVDPISGAQTIVSSGGNLSLGPEGVWINDSKPQSMLVTQYSTSNPTQSSVLDINTLTGAQTVVSSGGLLRAPHGVTQDALGHIFVTDIGSPNGNGKILEIDPVIGAQKTISSGEYLSTPLGIAVVVPEPGGLWLLMLGAGALTIVSARESLRRRRAT